MIPDPKRCSHLASHPVDCFCKRRLVLPLLMLFNAFSIGTEAAHYLVQLFNFKETYGLSTSFSKGIPLTMLALHGGTSPTVGRVPHVLLSASPVSKQYDFARRLLHCCCQSRDRSLRGRERSEAYSAKFPELNSYCTLSSVRCPIQYL